MKDLLKSSKRKKTYKNPKKRWSLQKQRIEEPRNESTKTKKRNKTENLKQNKYAYKNPKQILPEKDEEKKRISLYKEMISYLPV